MSLYMLKYSLYHAHYITENSGFDKMYTGILQNLAMQFKTKNWVTIKIIENHMPVANMSRKLPGKDATGTGISNALGSNPTQSPLWVYQIGLTPPLCTPTLHMLAHDNSNVTLVPWLSIFNCIARFRKIPVMKSDWWKFNLTLHEL